MASLVPSSAQEATFPFLRLNAFLREEIYQYLWLILGSIAKKVLKRWEGDNIRSVIEPPSSSSGLPAMQPPTPDDTDEPTDGPIPVPVADMGMEDMEREADDENEGGNDEETAILSPACAKPGVRSGQLRCVPCFHCLQSVIDEESTGDCISVASESGPVQHCLRCFVEGHKCRLIPVLAQRAAIELVHSVQGGMEVPGSQFYKLRRQVCHLLKEAELSARFGQQWVPLPINSDEEDSVVDDAEEDNNDAAVTAAVHDMEEDYVMIVPTKLMSQLIEASEIQLRT
ncbi:hypothetical protein B0T17DRAFT_615085 [Bombardia bombarda]|uniref:Uncharacterized protein n=1 Tax=Bombardia bombarda TaxID=252184 RepID=A0AA39X8T8_9PEZI|nr:hypothetical protein B0T17DRAFT_615085 [Bombardia bombarda]